MVTKNMGTGKLVKLGLIVAVIATGLFGATLVRAGISENSPETSPLFFPSESVILGLDEKAWTDAYDAAREIENNARQIMDAVFAIREGSIQGVAFSDAQLNALKDSGLAGMVQAVDRYGDLLGILNLSQAALNTWEASNPQPVKCYIQYQVAGCPTIQP